jgi:hypothetical protein
MEERRPFLTSEQFQEELAVLGLSGREFGPKDYAKALERCLGIEITICVFPDNGYPELVRILARSGKVAELYYSADQRTAVILAPESLPPVVRILAVYHELGHLAAGDLSKDPAQRLARQPPLGDKEPREEEADLRADYALLAGCLGPISPFSERMYDVL